MTNMPQRQEKDDSKEIRLFGEKSIREEAYRRKILELEQEIMQLETAGRRRVYSAASEEKSKKDDTPAARAKKPDVETAQEKNTVSIARETKKIITVFIVLATAALALSVFCLYAVLKISENYKGRAGRIELLGESSEKIKDFLQKNGLYSKQYSILSLTDYNRVYKCVIELHFKPHDTWTLKMIASDVIKNFNKVSPEQALELNFFYDGNQYAKIDFNPITRSAQYKFYGEK